MATSAPEVGTLSVLDAVFKELYPESRMEDASTKGHPFYKEVTKADDFEGDQLVVPLQHGKPQGRSALYQSAISNRTAAKTVKWVVTQKANYGYGHLDALAIRASRSNKGAFVKTIELEMDGVLRQHGDDIALDLYRAGYGAIARVSQTTSPSSTTITLDDAEMAINLEVGMTIEFAGTATGATPRTGGARESLQITKVDVDAGTIIVDAAYTNITGLTTGDYIFVEGDLSTSRIKILGLEAWLPLTAPSGSDSFLGVNRSVHTTRLAGHRQTDDGSPLPERMLKLAEKLTRDKATPDRCYMSHTNFTALALEMGAKVEYQGAGGSADIGFASFPVHTSAGVVKVMADRDCPNDRFYMLDLSTWCLHHLDGIPHLDNLDGNRVLRYTGGTTPQYSFQTISWAELICTAPGNNGVGEIA